MAAPWSGSDGYHVQLQRDSQFLCSDQRMHTELVDRLVLQLNRTYPQILTDKEAQRFRNLSVPTTVRLAELLVHLQGKGEEACHEFYRGLQIHAYNVYFNLPTRVSRRRGPLFFLSCFSLAVGLALLYYYGEGNLSATGPFLSFSVLGLGSEVLLAHAKDGSKIQ
ncbi:caspase recruitment domain-containing protein 19 isoform X2 [Salmo salar]|uniref:Caspase recruitment domain-containing protein 19-like n=2 Tax=Salmo TaxID=8028 RepID=A0A673X4Q3_SALTR|nr:caspase recruitment domain-containing protein 19 isoform X2 [Salmo salar]XP_029579523.1 caspase recruitment domain-containing protein 19-like isoform X2 [Salmo trutta]|eukprot:XP_013990270.1 PREDICTED: bcl10-interacting CARD protein-like isoform X2 [Salmo salar]